MTESDPVSAYLHFGYLPLCTTDSHSFLASLFDSEDREDFSSVRTPAKLIESGVNRLRRAFRNAVSGIGDRKEHVLPLSGGLDSRAILGGLLENLESSQIQAVTFGTPGTWDYEIGRQVARDAGVRCESLDLTGENWHWNTAALVRTARQMERPVWVFDAYVNRGIPERFGGDQVYWSGFMGDPLAGSHLPTEDSVTWEQAKARFVERNQFSGSPALRPPGFEPADHLPATPFMESDKLCYDEQLDFAIRQQCWIRHIVLPAGYEYRTPFLDPQWSDFILNVPREHRERQSLYREILKAAYARLLAMPVKANAGLPLNAALWRRAIRASRLRLQATAMRVIPAIDWGVLPGKNYIDFDLGLRQREDLKQTVHENLQDLKKRHIVDWINIDDIWQRHQHKQSNCARALLLLASLEIQIKAGRLGGMQEARVS